MSREDAQMKIRLPAELRLQVEDAAKVNNRSMNAEIVERLNQSFREGESDTALLDKGIARIEAQIAIIQKMAQTREQKLMDEFKAELRNLAKQDK